MKVVFFTLRRPLHYNQNSPLGVQTYTVGWVLLILHQNPISPTGRGNWRTAGTISISHHSEYKRTPSGEFCSFCIKIQSAQRAGKTGGQTKTGAAATHAAAPIIYKRGNTCGILLIPAQCPRNALKIKRYAVSRVPKNAGMITNHTLFAVIIFT